MEVRMMVRRVRQLGAASRAALFTVAVGAIFALAACGSQRAAGQSMSAGGPGTAPAPSGAALAGAALCQDIPRLTRVAVSSTTAFRAVQPRLTLPRGIIIVERGRVRGLAAALCGLPKMPPGPMTCLARFRGLLRFGFTAGGRPFPFVTVQVGGCWAVAGLGRARTARSAKFWRTLAEDTGLSPPPNTSQSGGINS
jgi:hypothetical protein